jgi:uncharacterized protein YndB with AHSA1/START domain
MARPDEIVRELHIEATPAEVFAYFIDAEKLTVWKAAYARSDPRTGGTYRMDITGGGDVAIGTYLEIDPPHRVVFTLSWEARDGAIDPAGVVEVTVTPDRDGTLLRLVHRGLTGPRRDHSAMGWAHYLDRLALAASGVDPGPDPWARTAGVGVTERARSTMDIGHNVEGVSP